jgi:hypothetical protein
MRRSEAGGVISSHFRAIRYGVLAGLAVLATAAVAQVPVPPPVHATLTRDDMAIVTMHKFARCVARAKPQVIASVLDRSPKDPAYHQMLTRLSQERTSCLPANSMMSFNDLSLASALAEWMLGHRFPGDALNRELVRHANDAAPAPRTALERISLCVARAAPTQTAALFATGPTSAEEETAIRAFDATLPACLGPHQAGMLAKPTLRGGLALAAYRIALQAPGAGKI